MTPTIPIVRVSRPTRIERSEPMMKPTASTSVPRVMISCSARRTPPAVALVIAAAV